MRNQLVTAVLLFLSVAAFAESPCATNFAAGTDGVSFTTFVEIA